MYLLNVHTMQLELFQDERNLKYAILSHRWQEEEILFQDLQTGRARKKAGYAKLKRFCEEAAAADYTLAWCDTCCIDKTSSAELGEAINSMFRWYQNSSACYAYLHDVKTTAVDDASSDFGDSEWFTRGWCLQELLAPRVQLFFNGNWKSLGTKAELCQKISDITGIHIDALRGHDLNGFSVAQRMSWAAGRATTRVEDIAYSLWGIFGVNMPLMYGEGERAFIRLQEEIMRQSSDQSILIHSSTCQGQRLFATSPADFRESSTIIRSDMRLIGEPYSLTNMGLSIELLLYPWTLDTYVALVDSRDERGPDSYVAIFLRLQSQIIHKGGAPSTDHTFRVKVEERAWITHPRISKLPSIQARVFIEDVDSTKRPMPPKRYGYWIRRFKGSNAWANSGTFWAISWNEWDKEKRILEVPDGTYATAGILQWEGTDDGGHSFSVPLQLGFTPRFEPVIEFGAHKKWSTDAIAKRGILSDTRWMTESRASKGNAVFWRSSTRDLPIRETLEWGLSGVVEISCEKVQVDGVETWAVDVVWQIGGKLQFSHRNALGEVRVVCDECQTNIRIGRFKCKKCPDFDLCSSCFRSAKWIHDPSHEFDRRS